MPHRACAAMALTACLAWTMPAAAQQLLFHFPLDGTASVAGSAAGEAKLYLLEEGPPPTTVPGKFGQALYFHGNAAIALPFNLDPVAYPSVTVTAWVKLDPDSRGERTVFSAGNGNVPRLTVYGNRAYFLAARAALMYETAMPWNEWVFVAGTVDIASQRIATYQGEGRLAEEGINVSNVYPSSGYRNPLDDSIPFGPYVFVGSHGFGQWRANQIAIDEVRVYAGALSAEQVAALRDVGAATAEPATLLASPSLPPPAPGTEGVFQNATPNLAVEDRPPGPLDLAGAAAGADGGVPLLEAPPTATAGAAIDPQLSAPDGLPAQQLEEAIAAAENATPTQPAANEGEEIYRLDADGPVRTMQLVFPGESVPQEVTFEEVDGLAVADGDMILGAVADLDQWQRAVEPEVTGAPGVRRQGLNAISNKKFLWPNGRIPFEISSELPAEQRARIAAAVLVLNSVPDSRLRVVERTPEDKDYVEFVQGNDETACSSMIGRQGRRQAIRFSRNGCFESTIIHEVLHAAGAKHEQSRPDRDEYVEILWDNIDRKRHNFWKASDRRFKGVGPYNFRSIMHYRPLAFGKPCEPNPPAGQTIDPDCQQDASGNFLMPTIRPRDPSATIQRDTSLASDFAAISALYPATVGPAQGKNWGDGAYATAAAVGDIDGDGRAEVIVGRAANDGSRFFVYDDASTQHALLATGGSDWDQDVAVTDVAVGDVDGDGVMEIGITRRAGSHNRFYVYRYRNGNLAQLFAGGADWGSGNYATAIAFGDVDGDGRDEIAVGRRATADGRYYLFDDATGSTPFRRLAIGGATWGSGNYTTGLAFGDVNGDGRQELGVTRHAGSDQRYEILAWRNGRLDQIHAGGQNWDSTHYGSAIAFGNIDDDAADEVVVGRRAASGSRFHVLDDQGKGFRLIETGGDLWGAGYYVVGVALADVDGDKRDEIMIARNSGEHGRYYVRNDRLRDFADIPVTGGLQDQLFSGVGATDIAAGDTDGDGLADVVVTYDEKVNERARHEVIYMKPGSD